MKANRIEQLIELLPSQAPYLARIPRELTWRGFPAETDLYAYASNDPGFGCGFIKSFLDLGKPLPTMVYESQLIRPYCYLRYHNNDSDARGAFELHRDRQSGRCILLECMLLRGEYDYPSIAKKLSITEATVQIYGTLFWNVRDRLDDRIYINTLVYPEGRQVELVPGYAKKEHPRNLALRITVASGLDAAEEFLGLRSEATGAGRAEQAEAFAAKILSTGNFLAKMGFLHQKLPALEAARGVLRLRKAGREQRAAVPVVPCPRSACRKRLNSPGRASLGDGLALELALVLRLPMAVSRSLSPWSPKTHRSTLITPEYLARTLPLNPQWSPWTTIHFSAPFPTLLD